MGKFKRLGFTLFFIITLLFQEISCSNFNKSFETGLTTRKFACNLNVIPIQYEISIGPVQNSNESFSVSAWIKIQLEISGADCDTSCEGNFNIQLNTRNCIIDLTNVNITKLVNKDQIQLKINEQLLEDNSTEENPSTNLIITSNETLILGDQVILHIPYEVKLTRDYYEESWQGLYYYDPQGINVRDYWTAKNYYPLHAQFMFPAFDYFNPTRKPTFKISVARYEPDGFISLSNSEILESVQITDMKEGWVTDCFQETPPMQLDQVTLMILGGYQNHTVHSAKNCAINMWTLKYGGLYENNSVFNTVKEIQKAMDFFENTFNQTEYPLSKIDFVGVPWNTGSLVFHTNLGIVAAQTESMLLQDDSGLEMTQDFLRTQLVFQWFRGMVTSGIPPQTDGSHQDDVWINGECLARYVGVWPLMDKKLENTGTASSVFHLKIDKYLLEIVESLFSQTIMETAIVLIYLPKVLRDGAFPQDLSDSIQQAIELHNATHILPQTENGTVTVTEIFNSWLSKRYQYPTIRITEVVNDTSSIAFYQENISENDSTQMWWVPLKILTRKGNLQIKWLSPNHSSLNSSLIFSSKIDTENEWLFVNPDSSVYYSTKYSGKLLQHIIKQLDTNHSEFSVAGRKYLLYNQFRLTIDYSWKNIQSALEMTKYLGNEMDLDVWTIAIEQMGQFRYDLMGYSDTVGKYFGNKINKILDQIGIHPKEGELSRLPNLRQKLMELCSTYEIPLCTKFATNLIEEWMGNKTNGNSFRGNVKPELREALYCAAVQNGNASVFHFMLDQIVKERVSGDSADILYESRNMCKALACANDEDLLASLLSENSELEKMEYNEIPVCWKEYIPYDILSKKPLTMKQIVYDFWMRGTVNGNIELTSFIRHLWNLAPREYEPPGFIEGILKFLKDHSELFTGDYAEHVRNFVNYMTNTGSQSNRFGELWRNDIGDKMVKWFKENME